MKLKLQDKATTQIHTVDVRWESDTEWHGTEEGDESFAPNAYLKALFELVEEIDEPDK